MESKRRMWMVGLTAFSMSLGLFVIATSDATANQFGTQDDRETGKEAPPEIGDKAPLFTVEDTEGKEHSLEEYTKDGKIVVLEWFNPGCPYVQYHYEDRTTMKDLAEDYKEKDVVWLAISSTHKGHPNFEETEPAIEKWDIEYPLLMDTDGEVGRAYGAKRTPHMYIIDKDGKLRYNGAIDNNPRARAPLSEEDVTNYVEQALDQIIAGETVTEAETKPYGCGVKYAD